MATVQVLLARPMMTALILGAVLAESATTTLLLSANGTDIVCMRPAQPMMTAPTHGPASAASALLIPASLVHGRVTVPVLPASLMTTAPTPIPACTECVLNSHVIN